MQYAQLNIEAREMEVVKDYMQNLVQKIGHRLTKNVDRSVRIEDVLRKSDEERRRNILVVFASWSLHSNLPGRSLRPFECRVPLYKEGGRT
ncbi:hypothetical protein Tco_1475240 [Tanacetum coccineum]